MLIVLEFFVVAVVFVVYAKGKQVITTDVTTRSPRSYICSVKPLTNRADFPGSQNFRFLYCHGSTP